MATMTNDQILEAIGTKTVVELAELIEAFKAKFNVSVVAAAAATTETLNLALKASINSASSTTVFVPIASRI